MSMKDERLQYTVMDDLVPKRGGKSPDEPRNQEADPPDHGGSGISYAPSNPNEEAPESAPESPPDTA